MIDQAYYDNLAKIESGGDRLAKNPASSARGLYQFTKATAKQYGITAKFGTEEYTRQEQEAVKKLTADNFKALKSALGRDPTHGELYLAHQQGAAGAQKLLTGGDMMASDIVGVDAVLNNKGTADMTASDFAGQWIKKMDDLSGESGQTLQGGSGVDTLQDKELMDAFSGLVDAPAGEDKELMDAFAGIGLKPALNPDIDYVTGAPAVVRASVGSAVTPQERIATLRSFYPDAKEYGDDNFVFTNPNTGKQTIYNPKGFQYQDLASIGRETAQFAGSIIGGAVGAVSGGATGGVTAPVVGAIPGATVGAIAGSGVGQFYAATAYDQLLQSFGIVKGERTAAQELGIGVSEVAGGSLGEAGGRAIGAGFKYAIGGGKATTKALYDQFVSLGIIPKASVVTGGGSVAFAEKGLQQTIGGAGTIYGEAEKVVESARASFDDIVSKFGVAKTKEGAGDVIQTAAAGAAERFQSKAAKMYEEVFDIIGLDTPVSVDNLVSLKRGLSEMTAQSAYLRAKYKPVIGQIDAIIADAEDGGLKFSVFRKIRTSIREDLGKRALVTSSGSEDALLGNVYDALTMDMSAAAQKVGGDAATKLKTADTFYATFMDDTAKLLDKIDKYDAESKAYTFALSSARDGGENLRKLRAVFKEDEWDTVAATVLNRLSAGRKGDFSIDMFLNNYKNLAPEAKDALFGGTRYKGAKQALDQFTDLAERLRDVEKMANTSNTAGAMNFGLLMYTLLGSAAGGAAGGAIGPSIGLTPGEGVMGGILAPYAAAKLITNQKFVSWLAEPLGTETFSMAAHVAKLYTIAETTPEIREEILQYSKAVQEATK